MVRRRVKQEAYLFPWVQQFVEGRASNRNGAGIRPGQASDHSERGGFPGPVWPDEPGNRPWSAAKAQLVDGFYVSERLRDVI